MYTNLPPSCKLFWFEFCIWNILVEMPNTRYKFVVYMVVFLPPEQTQCTWKSKKSRKNLTSSMASMATTTALGKILLSWPFFSSYSTTTWPSYFYFCTSVLCAVKSTTILTQMMIRSDVVVGWQKYQKLHSGFGVLK